ncbi:MAG TPA: hypothetical protein VGP85_13235 [Pyrinomonadaceae bacterium]|jgi:hypothetical protein|nr:hypothetical protein [Pyrinomonadaceae bacterium]
MNASRHRVILLLLLCVVGQSCASSSQKFTKEVQEAISWVASARMIGEAYVNGTIPKGYTKKALASFDSELRSSGQRLQSISDQRRAGTLVILNQAEQTVAQMQTALDDSVSFAQLNLRLVDQQRALAATTNPQAVLRGP